MHGKIDGIPKSWFEEGCRLFFCV